MRFYHNKTVDLKFDGEEENIEQEMGATDSLAEMIIDGDCNDNADHCQDDPDKNHRAFLLLITTIIVKMAPHPRRLTIQPFTIHCSTKSHPTSSPRS